MTGRSPSSFTAVSKARGAGRGAPTLVVSVVPDSGTGELTGRSGSIAITITGREHRYEFQYSITP